MTFSFPPLPMWPFGFASVIDPRNNTLESYQYDNLNRLTQKTDAAAKSTLYQYDGAGNLTQLTDRRSDEELVLPPLAAVVMYPAHELSDAEARLVRTGRPLAGRAEGPVALFSGDTLIAVGTGDGTMIQPETVLP